MAHYTAKPAVRVLAADLGAGSGRIILGSFDGEALSLQELHRFPNEPVFLHGTYYWDFLRLFREVSEGIAKAGRTGRISGLAVDTWGVDFGLLDRQGRLMGNPVHYRDGRTKNIASKVKSVFPEDKLYEITGTASAEINTLYQLLAVKEQEADTLERAKTLLMMPDLFNYFLSGVKAAEKSIVSTTQLADAASGEWSEEVISACGFPRKLFPDTVESGTVIGELSSKLCEELAVNKIKIIAAAGHDTQSAVAAIPAEEDDFIFLSCGTWSLLGTETARPFSGKNSRLAGMTNERGYGGKTAFIKNMTGLWLLQECRRQWQREGKNYSYALLTELASKEKPSAALIDPGDPVFASSGNMPGMIKDYLKSRGETAPDTDAKIVRCIEDSLARSYRQGLDGIKTLTGKRYEKIYMVGGGVQDNLLRRLTASACGLPVYAGPQEATALGNIAVQLIALGYIKDLQEARDIIRRTEY